MTGGTSWWAYAPSTRAFQLMLQPVSIVLRMSRPQSAVPPLIVSRFIRSAQPLLSEQRLTGDHIPPSTPCPLRGRVVACSSPEEVAFTPIVPDDCVSALRRCSRHPFAPAWL